MITIKSTLSQKDVQKGLYTMMMFNLAHRGMKYFGIGMISLGLIRIITEYLENHQFVFDFPLFFIGFVLLYYHKGVAYYSAKKLFNSKNFITESATYEFSESDMSVVGETYNSKMAWGKIHLVRESNEFIFIYLSFNTAHIIPKRFFDDESYNGLLKILAVNNCAIKK